MLSFVTVAESDNITYVFTHVPAQVKRKRCQCFLTVLATHMLSKGAMQLLRQREESSRSSPNTLAVEGGRQFPVAAPNRSPLYFRPSEMIVGCTW